MFSKEIVSSSNRWVSWETAMLRFVGRKLNGECSWDQHPWGNEGSSAEQREKLGCDAVTTETHPLDISGAEMALSVVLP